MGTPRNAEPEHGSARPGPKAVVECGFNPALASHPTRALALDHVIDLLQVTHAPDVIDAYRSRMEAGDLFPPVSVIILWRWVLLADGHKRFSAYRGLGRADIEVEVWPLKCWLLDQWRQVMNNANKNKRIAALLFTDPGTARRMMLSTFQHWRRVLVSLLKRGRLIT